MIHSRLILHHNMGMKCVEDPFNMGMFFVFFCFYLRRPSQWVHFQTRHTHPGILYPNSPPGRGLGENGGRGVDVGYNSGKGRQGHLQGQTK